MIADEVNMNRGTVRLILTEELVMRKICAKMLPRNLTQQQRDARLSVCADLLEQVEVDPELMDRVITGEESWFFRYDPEAKHQSLKWPKKARKATHLREKTLNKSWSSRQGVCREATFPTQEKLSAKKTQRGNAGQMI